MMFVQQVYVAGSGSATLSGHIRKSVACTGTHSDGKRKSDAMVHETVKYSACEYSAEDASFKDQTCISVNNQIPRSLQISSYARDTALNFSSAAFWTSSPNVATLSGWYLTAILR